MDTQSIVTTDVKKVTVTITRKQMFDNYVDQWREIVWDGCVDVDAVKLVLDTLVHKDSLNPNKVKNLFGNGHTYMLLSGSAMDLLDQPDILREIHVVDGEKTIVIEHGCIRY